jgi:hypothetical protein
MAGKKEVLACVLRKNFRYRMFQHVPPQKIPLPVTEEEASFSEDMKMLN